jgi:hypothetical protein
MPRRLALSTAVMHAKHTFLHVFKEYSDTEQSLTYPSEKLVETVGAVVILVESVMTEMAHLNSVEQHITAAIKNSTDFEWIRCTGCSLHHQQILGACSSLMVKALGYKPEGRRFKTK